MLQDKGPVPHVDRLEENILISAGQIGRLLVRRRQHGGSYVSKQKLQAASARNPTPDPPCFNEEAAEICKSFKKYRSLMISPHSVQPVIWSNQS